MVRRKRSEFMHLAFTMAIACGVVLAVAAKGYAQSPDVHVAVVPLQQATLNTGDTAWMLTSSALVMLMVPGLALFYAGMVRRKNVLGTMMHSMAALGIIGVEWVVIGYAMAFRQSQHGLIGWDSQLLFFSAESRRKFFTRARTFRNWCLSCSRGCSRSSRRR